MVNPLLYLTPISHELCLKKYLAGRNDNNASLKPSVHQLDPLQKRYEYVAVCQEHYYKAPPQIERGYKQYLYDIYGRGYIDMVNNVAVVGHSHPKIAHAVYKQLNILNTNSRFIYSAFSDYAESIIETIPKRLRDKGKLNKVFFVNSGSEATDLAMRIARTVVSERRLKASSSGGFKLSRDIICIQGGYHGVTTASDEVSTTLNDNPRSLETRAPWIHLVPMPNHFRGIYRLTPSEYYDREAQINLADKYVGK
jgi:4-aminobutyrate aminotransferase-like enzyme